MSSGIRVFSSKCGSKSIDIAKRAGIVFNRELAGYGKVGLFGKEIFGHISFIFIISFGRYFGDVFIHDGGNLEHFSCSLTVGCSDNRSMDIKKSIGLEKEVCGKRKC